MSIQYFEGDLLESGCDYICHQVNCQGVMGSGIAKSIREKWPVVFEKYKIFLDNPFRQAGTGCYQVYPLGQIQYVDVNDKQTVINMFSQQNYGYDNQRYTSYDAFVDALCEIRKGVPKGSRIGFPYGIGCVRGGASWNIIHDMIAEELGNDYQVEIWRFDKG